MAFALAASSVFGQAPTGRAEVVGVVGTAVYSTSGNASLPLNPGDRLAEGLILKTGPRSAVDLSLGPRAGILRLTENTTVSLDQLAAGGAAPDTQVQIKLNVTEGTVVGFNNKLTTAAKYEVKTSTGIAAIGGSEFRVDSRGHVVLLAGTVLVAYVPAGGEPVIHTLKAPPASYFSPQEGVRPTPKALEQEVRAQCKPKLRPH
jgi:hypothetical protein